MIIIETISKTEQQLLLEMEELQTRLDATERRLQEDSEILQAQIAHFSHWKVMDFLINYFDRKK